MSIRRGSNSCPCVARTRAATSIDSGISSLASANSGGQNSGSDSSRPKRRDRGGGVSRGRRRSSISTVSGPMARWVRPVSWQGADLSATCSASRIASVKGHGPPSSSNSERGRSGPCCVWAFSIVHHRHESVARRQVHPSRANVPIRLRAYGSEHRRSTPLAPRRSTFAERKATMTDITYRRCYGIMNLCVLSRKSPPSLSSQTTRPAPPL